MRAFVSFQSSPGRKAGRYLWTSQQWERIRMEFQSSPGRKAGRYLLRGEALVRRAVLVSILARP